MRRSGVRSSSTPPNSLRIMRGLLFALVLAAHSAWGQTFPAKPITLIVPFPPGGSTDTAARIIGERMRMPLGQSVIIENVGGAGGAIALARVARAAPDGYTIDIGQGDRPGGAIIYPITLPPHKHLSPSGSLPINPHHLLSDNAIL